MGCEGSKEYQQELQDRKDIQTARGIAARKYIAAHQVRNSMQYSNTDAHMLFGVQGERGAFSGGLSGADDGGDGGGHGMGGDSGGGGGDTGGGVAGGDSGGGGGDSGDGGGGGD
jgi:hypothetical protein